MLREGYENALSILIGEISPDDAGRIIGQTSSGARYTTVGQLREAGFTVKHTPSPENPLHASVSVAGRWTEEKGRAFSECFGPPKWIDDPEEQT